MADTSSGELALLEHPVTITLYPSSNNIITHHLKLMGQVNTGPQIITLPMETSCQPLNCSRGQGFCCACHGDHCSCAGGLGCERLHCVIDSNIWYDLHKPQSASSNQSIAGKFNL